MRLYEYLKENTILLDVKAKTRKEAIEEIAATLKGERNIIDFEKFLSRVFEREKQASTGIGYGVAIPHARTNTVEDIVVAFGRSQGGIDFASIDGKPVKLIFLIGTPEKKKLSLYLKLLAHLSRILKKEDFRKKLLVASTPKEILDELRKIET